MIAISLPSLVQAAQEVPISADCVYQGIDCSQEIFRVLAGGWLDRAFAIGETIFLALVALEIVVSGYALWFGKMRDSDVLSTFFFKMGLLAVMMVAIQTYGMWMPNIVYLGSDMAAQVTGEEELNNIRPQHLMNEGFRAFLAIYASLWDAARADNVDGGGDGDGGFRRLWSWTIGIGNTTADLAQMLWMGLLVLIPAMIILFCFIYIAMQWLMVTVESYLVIAAGAIFLGFMAFRGTAGMGEEYLKYIVSVTVKLFFLGIIAAAAMGVGPVFEAVYSDFTSIEPQNAGEVVDEAIDYALGPIAALYSMVVVLAALAMLAKGLPSAMANRMSGAISFGIRQFLSRG